MHEENKKDASFVHTEFDWLSPILKFSSFWEVQFRDCILRIVIKLWVLTLIGMRSDIFISLSFLDQILSADFLSKLSKLFEGENWHQLGYFDTLPCLLSLLKIPLIALIWIGVDPAVMQNCVASVTNKSLLKVALAWVALKISIFLSFKGHAN